MESPGRVFISYSHDDEEHIGRVLELSNRLRQEGVDCVLDQYESSPPEGWPAWMDRNLRDADYVLVVCTRTYYRRIIDDEKEEGQGLGARWEGHLIRQHLYSAGAINTRFLPVIFEPDDTKFIPTPLQGSTHYDISKPDGYEDLYRRLTNQPRISKPDLGRLQALQAKSVRTDPRIFLTGPILPALWDRAEWQAVGMFHYADRPPTLGLAFEDEAPAREIFTDWRHRFGTRDTEEELRIAIIEGDLPGEEPGYFVHIGMNPEVAITKLGEAGYDPELDLWLLGSRVHRMHPEEDSVNLEMFKEEYRSQKAYNLAPFIVRSDRRISLPFDELAIYKTEIQFRDISQIQENDIDMVILSWPWSSEER